MFHKRFSPVVFALLFILLISCTTEQQDEQIEITQASSYYVLFTLNYNDWTFPEKSIAALEKVIAIHEKYAVPIDIYLSDPTFQNIMKDKPAVVEKLKTSTVVAVAYHLRPPMPAYENYDFLGLEEMTEQERYETLLEYEEYRLNLETGMPDLEQPGGYQYIKDTIGYAPTTVAVQNRGAIVSTMKQIYKEKGAVFLVKHDTSKNFKLGDKDAGWYIRPEDIEIKWYDFVAMYGTDEAAAEQVIKEQIAAEEMSVEGTGVEAISATSTEPLFINIKMHENNFYAEMPAPFWDIFSKDRKPPFDLSPAYDHEMLSEEEIAAMWEFYESAVAYVNKHPELYTAVNTFDLQEMVKD